MTDKPAQGEESSSVVAAEAEHERLVYVMPEQLTEPSPRDEIDLLELWRTLWARKYTILIVTVILTLISGAYALVAPKWYRAEVLLAPADEKSAPSIGEQLGGLAALAGVSVGNGGDSIEAIATLNSRDFAREFIEGRELLTVLLAKEWDEENERWRATDPSEHPDIRDAVHYFHENVLRVSENPQTGLVTLAIEWTDPYDAADWARDLVGRLNGRLRERALRDAEVNVDFLQAELEKTNVVTLQQAIGRLLETELQKLMLARGSEEFGFRVIDTAQVPKEPVRPRLVVAIAFGLMLGIIAGVLIALRGRHSTDQSSK